jgi:superoxide dismutase, Cu-Zn family
MKKSDVFTFFAMSAAVTTAAVGLWVNPGSAEARTAYANLRGPDRAFVGTVKFTNSREYVNQTSVELRLDRAPTAETALNQFHGFHVHANNDPVNGDGCIADPTSAPSSWFTSADGHWTKDPAVHSQHSGDMPSVLINADGTATLKFTTGRMDMDGLVNRAVVVHAAPDNFGNVPVGSAPNQYIANSPAALDLTQRTGNASDRIACGVVTQ